MPRTKRTKAVGGAPAARVATRNTRTSKLVAQAPEALEKGATRVKRTNGHGSTIAAVGKQLPRDATAATRGKQTNAALVTLDPNTQVPRRRPVKKVMVNEEQSKAIEALRRRRESAARAERGEVTTSLVFERPPAATEAQPTVERIGDSQATGGQGAILSSSPPKAPASTMRVQATPTSVPALANFKRRPRQPSILRMVQRRAEPEVDDDDDNFNPDGESTPFHQVAPVQSPADSGREGQGSPSASRSSSSRKRKASVMEDVQVPRSQNTRFSSPVHPPDDEPRSRESSLPEDLETMARLAALRTSSGQQKHAVSQTVEGDDEDPIQRIMATEESSDLGAHEMPEPSVAHNDDEAPNGTMAEPLSSSPPRFPFSSAQRKGQGRDTSPSVLTTRKYAELKRPQLNTAALQALLPARRGRRGAGGSDEFDVPSSSPHDDEEDEAAAIVSDNEDELGRPVRRTGRRRPLASKGVNTAVKSPVTPRGGKGKGKSRGKTISTFRAAAGGKSPGTRPKTRTTYSRGRASSDKENEGTRDLTPSSPERSDTGNDGLPPHRAPSKPRNFANGKRLVSAELEAAKKKFAAVDRWEMDFEGSNGDHRSSSSGYR